MRVDIYTTPTCGYCHQAKQYLAEVGVPFNEHDVSRDRPAAEEMVRLTGQMGVPVIVVDGEPIIGFNRARLEQLLAGARRQRGVSLGLKAANTSRYARERGAYIGAVAPASTGERARLRQGDIVTSINGARINGVGDLEEAAAGLQTGMSVTIEFIRDGRALQSKIAV